MIIIINNIKNILNRKEIALWRVTAQLRGIAILGVVINHAAAFGITVYRFNHMQVDAGYEALNGIPWASVMPGWIVLQELTRFPVPLFIILAGHYIKNLNGKWLTIWKQAENLLYPFLFWSFIGWLYSYLFSPPGWDVLTFLHRLINGAAQPGYFFIPLIIQYYILSRWFVPWVKEKPKFALFITLFIQLGWIGFNYLAVAIKGKVIPLPIELPVLPEFMFPRFLFFFIFGIWMGVYPDRFKTLLKGKGTLLFVVTILSAVFLIAEHGVLYYFIRKPEAGVELWRVFLAMAQWKVSSNIFSFFFILFLIKLGQYNLFSWKWLTKLGGWTYVIYILNGPLHIPLMNLLKNWSISQEYHFLIFFALSIITVFVPILILQVVQRWAPWARYIIAYK